jgi:hypothetical protein
MISALATVFSKLDGQRRFLGPFLPAPQTPENLTHLTPASPHPSLSCYFATPAPAAGFRPYLPRPAEK